MNEQLEGFARQTIKDGLAKLPEGHRRTFKRLYAGSGWNEGIDINMVADEMPVDKLDVAMEQVKRSLKKLGL